MLAIIMSINDENDRAFVEQLYEKYSRKMYLIAKNILKNREDSEDCVSETVSIIIDNLDRFKSAEGDHLIKLLVICCRNVALGIYRVNKKRYTSSLTIPNIEDEDDYRNYDIPDIDADIDRLILSEYNCRLISRYNFY